MNIVIDANLLIVLVNQYPRTEMVRQQFNDWIEGEVQMHSPKLALYEIANALTRLIVGGIFPRNQLESAWYFLNDLPIIYHEISEGLE